MYFMIIFVLITVPILFGKFGLEASKFCNFGPKKVKLWRFSLRNAKFFTLLSKKSTYKIDDYEQGSNKIDIML